MSFKITLKMIQFICRCTKMQFLYLIIGSSILITINILSKQNMEQSEGFMIIEWPQIVNHIGCHNSVEDDALQSVEDPIFHPKSKSIFFHETSCRGGLNSRQACTVESAAKAHPDWDVHLLFNSPIREIMIKKTCIGKLLEYPNVKLARVHPFNYSKDTPVHSIVTQILGQSLHPVEHSADIMKILTLNKWGGIYLDLDQMVINSLNNLTNNWVVKETDTDLAGGVMAFAKDAIGQDITNSVLQEIHDTYNPTSWSENGPSVIERVLMRRCNVTKLQDHCEGVTIFSPERFYPINYTWAHLYFRKGGEAIKFSNIYTHHLWDLMSKIYEVGPTMPYAELAREYCPKIYHMYGESFGV